MTKTKSDQIKAKNDLESLSALAEDYTVKVQNCLLLSDGANIEDAKEDIARLRKTIKLMKSLRSTSETVNTSPCFSAFERFKVLVIGIAKTIENIEKPEDMKNVNFPMVADTLLLSFGELEREWNKLIGVI